MKIVDNTVIQGNLSLSDYLYLSVGVNDGTRLYGINPTANGNTNGLTVLHMGDDLGDYASGGQAFVIRFGNFTTTSITSDIGSSTNNFSDAISFKTTATSTLTTVYNALNLNFITSAGFLKSDASGNVSIDTNTYALASAVAGFTSGSGTINRLSKWSATQTLTDSNISDNGSLVTVLSALTVNGKATFAVTTASNASVNIPNSSLTPSLVDGDIYATSDELKYYNKSALGIDTYVVVKAISTSNIATLSGTSATIDGQTLAVGDVVCLQGQTTQSQNGVYVVASSTWSRASSFTTEAQLLLRDIYVLAGTTYKGTWWMCGNKGTITVGTTAIVITQIPNGILYGAGYAISSNMLSASAPLSYNNTTGVFTISQANTSTAGYLSAADWNTFNNKQAALTNPVTGTGTSGFYTKFTGTTTVGNGIIFEANNRIEFGSTWASLDTTTKGIVLKEGYQLTLGHNTAETYVLLDQVRSDNSQRNNILTVTNSAGFIPTLNIASAMTGTVGVFSSTLTATKFITSGGTASQFVKGNGDLDGTSYAPLANLANYLLLSGGQMTGRLNLYKNGGTAINRSTHGFGFADDYSGLTSFYASEANAINALGKGGVGASDGPFIYGYAGVSIGYSSTGITNGDLIAALRTNGLNVFIAGTLSGSAATFTSNVTASGYLKAGTFYSQYEATYYATSATVYTKILTISLPATTYDWFTTNIVFNMAYGGVGSATVAISVQNNNGTIGSSRMAISACDVYTPDQFIFSATSTTSIDIWLKGYGSQQLHSWSFINERIGTFTVTRYSATSWQTTAPTPISYTASYLSNAFLSLQGGTVSGNITATKFITSGGTATQFVKGDGSLDPTTYLSGNQTITLTGGATGSGTTSIAVTLTNASVTGQALTGLSVATNSAIAATDSILVGLGKAQAHLTAIDNNWANYALVGHGHSNYVFGDNNSATSLSSGTFAAIKKSGFYSGSAWTDSPVANTWTHLIHNQYVNDTGTANTWSFDIAANFGSAASPGSPENYYMRCIAASASTGWRKLWHDGNFSPSNYSLTSHVHSNGAKNYFGYYKNLGYSSSSATIDMVSINSRAINGYEFTTTAVNGSVRIQNLGFDSTGGLFVVSFWAKASVAGVLTTDLCDAAPYIGSATTSLTTTYQKVELYFNTASYVGTPYYGFLDMAFSVVGTVSIKNLMVERGSNVSDYSVASEDLRLGSGQGYYGTRTENISTFDTLLRSGFYDSNTYAGPFGTVWSHLIRSTHTDPTNAKDKWSFDISAAFASGNGVENYAVRVNTNLGYGAWRTLWHTGNLNSDSVIVVNKLTSNTWPNSNPGYTSSGATDSFSFCSTGGVVNVYADGNFYATDSKYPVWHTGNHPTTLSAYGITDSLYRATLNGAALDFNAINSATPGAYNCFVPSGGTLANNPNMSIAGGAGFLIQGYGAHSFWDTQLFISSQSDTLQFRTAYDLSGTKTWRSWYAVWHTGNLTPASIGAAPSVAGGYLPLSGGAMTGSITFANGTWNVVGDDAAIGNINEGATLGLKGNNSSGSYLRFCANGSSIASAPSSGIKIGFDGSQFVVNGGDLTNSGLRLSYYSNTAYSGIWSVGVTKNDNNWAFLTNTTNSQTYLNSSGSLELQIFDGTSRNTRLQITNSFLNTINPIKGVQRPDSDYGTTVFAPSTGSRSAISNGNNSVKINRYDYAGFVGYIGGTSSFFGMTQDHENNSGGQLSIIAGGGHIAFFGGSTTLLSSGAGSGCYQAQKFGYWSNVGLFVDTDLSIMTGHALYLQGTTVAHFGGATWVDSSYAIRNAGATYLGGNLTIGSSISLYASSVGNRYLVDSAQGIFLAVYGSGNSGKSVFLETYDTHAYHRKNGTDYILWDSGNLNVNNLAPVIPIFSSDYSTTTYRLVNTLPAGENAGSGDTLYWKITGGGWSAGSSAIVEGYVKSRDGTATSAGEYYNEVKGSNQVPNVRVQGYRNADGTLSVYLVLTGSYIATSVQFWVCSGSTQQVLYSLGADTTTAPTGTLIFDTYNNVVSRNIAGTSWTRGIITAGYSGTNNSTLFSIFNSKYIEYNTTQTRLLVPKSSIPNDLNSWYNSVDGRQVVYSQYGIKNGDGLFVPDCATIGGILNLEGSTPGSGSYASYAKYMPKIQMFGNTVMWTNVGDDSSCSGSRYHNSLYLADLGMSNYSWSTSYSAVGNTSAPTLNLLGTYGINIMANIGSIYIGTVNTTAPVYINTMKNSSITYIGTTNSYTQIDGTSTAFYATNSITIGNGASTANVSINSASMSITATNPINIGLVNKILFNSSSAATRGTAPATYTLDSNSPTFETVTTAATYTLASTCPVGTVMYIINRVAASGCYFNTSASGGMEFMYTTSTTTSVTGNFVSGGILTSLNNSTNASTTYPLLLGVYMCCRVNSNIGYAWYVLKIV